MARRRHRRWPRRRQRSSPLIISARTLEPRPDRITRPHETGAPAEAAPPAIALAPASSPAPSSTSSSTPGSPLLPPPPHRLIRRRTKDTTTAALPSGPSRAAAQASGQTDGTALAIGASTTGGRDLDARNSARRGSPDLSGQLLIGSAGAVIGFGASWGLSRFGFRPTLGQAAWYANTTAWGTLAGLYSLERQRMIQQHQAGIRIPSCSAKQRGWGSASGARAAGSGPRTGRPGQQRTAGRRADRKSA